MTRVLHVVEAYGGGVETAVQAYVQSLPDDEHLLLARCRVPHVTGVVHDIWSDVRLVDTTLIGLYTELRRMCRESRPDVIHAHSSYAGAIARLLPAGAPPVVYSPHCFAVERQDMSWQAHLAVRHLERLLGRRGCVIAVLSPHEAQLARALSPRSTVHLVPNTAPVCQPRMRWDGRQPLRIVTVGRISRQKDPSFCSDVARLLPPSFTWSWVGGGDPDLASALRGSGVKVTGWLDHRDVQAALADSDLMVHTAAWEGSPMTLLEGLSSGLAVIARSLPSLDSLNYYTGGRSPASVASAVRAFVDNPAERDCVYAAGDSILRDATQKVQRLSLQRCYKAAVTRPSTVRKDTLAPVQPSTPKSLVTAGSAQNLM